MARAKKYNEKEVIAKAMQTFWINGYEATSVRMLEKDMGINQFSIYASFNNKEGVFIESLRCYRAKIKHEIIDKMNTSSNGLDDIKQYFYDFINFAKDINHNRGCLITNTLDELGEHTNSLIKKEIINLASTVHSSFSLKLKQHYSNDDDKTINIKANNLMIALQGISVGSKIYNQEQLTDFIENTFSSI